MNKETKLLKTYRFEFSKLFKEHIAYFSKVHQYDFRHDFKTSFKVWMLENCELVETEKQYLLKNGYNGNIENKIYTSCRFYFRKKQKDCFKNSIINKKRNYIFLKKEYLEELDACILEEYKTFLLTGLKEGGDFKPHKEYEKLLKNNPTLIKKIIVDFKENGMIVNEIEKKIKKTFKNRITILLKS
jgi:hypothetical protein